MSTSSVNLRGRLHIHVQLLSLSLMLCGSHGVYHSDLPSGELLWGCSWWRAFSCRTSRSTIAFSQGHVLQGLASDWTQCLVSPALGGAPLRSSSCFGTLHGPGWDFLRSAASGSSYPTRLLSVSPFTGIRPALQSGASPCLLLPTPASSHRPPSQAFPLNKSFRV